MTGMADSFPHSPGSSSMKLAIRRVVNVKQTQPAVFDLNVRLSDGTAAIVSLSAVAFTELIQRGEQLFQLGAPVT
jgi:hypothetical protein